MVKAPHEVYIPVSRNLAPGCPYLGTNVLFHRQKLDIVFAIWVSRKIPIIKEKVEKPCNVQSPFRGSKKKPYLSLYLAKLVLVAITDFECSGNAVHSW